MNHETVQKTLKDVFERIRARSESSLQEEIMSRTQRKYASALRDSGYFDALNQEAASYIEVQNMAINLSYTRNLLSKNRIESTIWMDEHYCSSSIITSWSSNSTDPSNSEFVIDGTEALQWMTMTAA